MHLPNSPTVRQLLPVKRVLAGALIAGAAAAAAPSIADAATLSTCAFDTSLHRVTITDKAVAGRVKVIRIGDVIAIQDAATGNGDIVFCASGSTSATVNNVANIVVVTEGEVDEFGGVQLDMSQGPLGPGFQAESDGQSEIEVQVRVNHINRSSNLEIIGTPQADTIRVSGGSNVHFGFDSDTDVNIVRQSDLFPISARRITLSGGAGKDLLSGSGIPVIAGAPPTTAKIVAFGGLDNDRLIGGKHFNDELFGGPGNDIMHTAEGIPGDVVRGDDGSDVAQLDARDKFFPDVEQPNGGIPNVGTLKLAPAVVAAKPGKLARMRMSWTHPLAWKALRAVELRVSDGGKRIGTVTVKPRSGRVVARGIKLVRGKVSHRGKTVTAKLAVRVPKALAGHKLRVDVQATDSTGRTQLAPRAGLIRVGR
jgi:hypothetical protein